jgi:hypothetical protein
LQSAFKSANTPPVHADLSFDEVQGNSTTLQGLQFYASGTGEVSVSVGLSFIPGKLVQEPIYRGIYVEKIVQRLDPFSEEAVGPALTSIETGTIVKVTIQITTPDYLGNVQVTDPLPGGLEALDENLEPVSEWMANQDWFRWFYYNAFPHKEIRADRVVIYGRNLYGGTHTITYKALAVTPGKFVFPSTLVNDVLQPEVMGLSAAIMTEITDSSLPPLATTEPIAEDNCLGPRPVKPYEPAHPTVTSGLSTGDEFVTVELEQHESTATDSLGPGATAGIIVGVLLGTALLVGAALGLAYFHKSRAGHKMMA